MSVTPPAVDRPPERPRIADLGAAAQAAIPALYAWGLTVAPAAWGKGSPLAAKGCALLGVVLLATATVVERKRPDIARPLSVWGLVVTSIVTWALSGSALQPGRLDAVRGLLGGAGWLLFAFASSAPPIRRQTLTPARIAAGAKLRPRGTIPRFDAAYIVLGVVAALAFQTVGWRVATPERAILVRLVMLAAGLAVLGAATDLAVTRHAPRVVARSSRRLRGAVPRLVAVVVLSAGGAALVLLR